MAAPWQLAETPAMAAPRVMPVSQSDIQESNPAEQERYANGEMALTFPIFRMRCGLRPMTRVAWSALIVLMLEALPTDAFAQSPVCHAIRRGESATQAARRMTGNGRNAYQAWFQIMNASSRFVPKSQYDRIHAGWRACVMPAIRSLSSNANHVEEPEAADVSEAPNGSGVREVLAAPTRTRERRRRRWRRR